MKKITGICIFFSIAAGSFSQGNNLDYFIGQAIISSPLLKEFQGQIASFSIDSQIIRAGLRTQVNGISNNLYAPVIHGWGYDNAITNGAQLTALVSASRNFLNNKSLSSLFSNLSIQSLTAGNAVKISEQDIKKAVTDQYITVYGDQIQLDFNNYINRLLTREDSLLKVLTQNSVFKQTEYLSFTVTRQQQQLNTTQLQIQYEMDYSALNLLSGITDTTIVPLRDPGLSLSQLGDFNGSVFYKQFLFDSLKLLNDKALVDLNYRPKINAFADAGYFSSLAYLPYKNFGTSIGVGISVPIYDGRQRQMQYSKIDIQERNRANKRDYFVQQHQQQLLLLTQQLNATARIIDQLNKQIKFAETLITVNEKLLATGDIRVVDFVLAINNYYAAKNLLTENYISRLKIINQLNYWAR